MMRLGPHFCRTAHFGSNRSRADWLASSIPHSSRSFMRKKKSIPGSTRVAKEADATLIPDSKALDPIFDAYRELRILHQLDFANYKLQDDHRVISVMPRRQLVVLSQVVFACIVLLVVMHSGLLAGVLF